MKPSDVEVRRDVWDVFFDLGWDEDVDRLVATNEQCRRLWRNLEEMR